MKPAWRPFVGPLSDSAVLTSIAAINSLMAYLVDAGYLSGNPLGLIRQRRRKLNMAATGPAQVIAQTEEMQKIERFLDAEMWHAVTRAIEALPRETAGERDEYERARFIAALLYMLAPRAGELESHRMNSFREERGRWWWHVVGKGGKQAKVPVADDMVHALVRYRKHLGLSAMPKRTDLTPLLVSIKDRSPITARRLNQILKKLFNAAAELLPEASEHKREKLRAATPDERRQFRERLRERLSALPPEQRREIADRLREDWKAMSDADRDRLRAERREYIRSLSAEERKALLRERRELLDRMTPEERRRWQREIGR